MAERPVMEPSVPGAVLVIVTVVCLMALVVADLVAVSTMAPRVVTMTVYAKGVGRTSAPLAISMAPARRLRDPRSRLKELPLFLLGLQVAVGTRGR